MPASGDPALDARGGDADLAALIAEHPGELVRFAPDPSCDVARAIGLTAQSSGRWEVAIDALRVRAPSAGGASSGADALAVNMLIVGTRPDRLRAWSRTRSITVTVDGRAVFDGGATSVVVANGQYLGASDVVPRGHPGDGRVEVQVYALTAGERRAMRSRLVGGTHLPHPRIVTGSGRQVEVRVEPATGAELDGRTVAPEASWTVEVVAGAIRLLV